MLVINNIDPKYQLDLTGDINFTGDLYEGGSLFKGAQTFSDLALIDTWLQTRDKVQRLYNANLGSTIYKGQGLPNATCHEFKKLNRCSIMSYDE